ncbi:MAG TPA: hypothetical protein PLP27_06435 [Crocinitomicaceae bacterium]|nr:hypothetical protein [Crocinitomicaceae bacterium]
MGIFNFFRKKKHNELQPLRVQKLSLKDRLQKADRQMYIANVAVTYKDEPVRMFKINVPAHTSGNAAYLVKNHIGVKIVSVHKSKIAKHGKNSTNNAN